MDYEKKLKQRLYLAIIFIISGIVFTALYCSGISGNQTLLSAGVIFAVVGFARLVWYRKVTKDEESIRRQKIAETDERNIAICNKSKSMAFGLYVFGVALIVVVLEIFGKTEIATVLALNVCVLIILYQICYFIYRRKL